VLAVLATVFGGLLAGPGLDRVIVQDPAWQHFEPAIRTRFTQEADLGHGIRWYPVEGLTALALSCAAAWSISAEDREARGDAAEPAYAAAAFSIVALVVTAAAIVPNTRAVVTDERVARATFDHLTMWWKGKAALHVATFVANVLSVATLRRG
jgi:hypothetical protein